jgi:hypothetical protein
MNAIIETIDKPTSQTSRTAKCLGSCRRLIAQIEQSKNSILAQFRDVLETNEHLLRLALNEAEALAWQTSYPHLVFPMLAVEKAQAVSAWHSRQRLLRGADPMDILAA